MEVPEECPETVLKLRTIQFTIIQDILLQNIKGITGMQGNPGILV